MTAWTTISNLLVAVGAKPFATTIQALRDNPISISEGASGAPVLSSAWHPYDMVNVADGATGLFYDVAVSGSTGTITSPTFADGYDYLVRATGLSLTAGQPINLNGGALTTALNGANTYSLYVEIPHPTLLGHPKFALAMVRQEGAGISNAVMGVATAAALPFFGFFSFSSFASAMTSLVLTSSGGAQYDAGKYFCYRRRNFIGG